MRTPTTLDPEVLKGQSTAALYRAALAEVEELKAAIDREANTAEALYDQIDYALINIVRALTAATDKAYANDVARLSVIERPYDGLSDEEALSILRGFARA